MTTYKEAGVDIDAADTFVNRIKLMCPEIGGFGGLYPFGDNYLVAGTDGVGTKLKLAFQAGKHDTVGIDLVAMSVNDVLTTGAKPLFFLDYFATSKLDIDQAEQVVKGIVEGCKEAECLLLGGETAEMPGFYQHGEYDLAGFAVGVVAKDKLIDGKKIRVGDLLVGIASSGFHSNGFSLVRKIINPEENLLPYLVPTRIYVRELLAILPDIKGMAHITGGGLPENVPRMFPEGLGAKINRGSWKIPEPFLQLQRRGRVSDEEMFRTFNMGIGMVLAMDQKQAKDLCRERAGYSIIGEVVKGKGVIGL